MSSFQVTHRLFHSRAGDASGFGIASCKVTCFLYLLRCYEFSREFGVLRLDVASVLAAGGGDIPEKSEIKMTAFGCTYRDICMCVRECIAIIMCISIIFELQPYFLLSVCRFTYATFSGHVISSF